MLKEGSRCAGRAEERRSAGAGGQRGACWRGGAALQLVPPSPSCPVPLFPVCLHAAPPPTTSGSSCSIKSWHTAAWATRRCALEKWAVAAAAAAAAAGWKEQMRAALKTAAAALAMLPAGEVAAAAREMAAAMQQQQAAMRESGERRRMMPGERQMRHMTATTDDAYIHSSLPPALHSYCFEPRSYFS